MIASSIQYPLNEKLEASTMNRAHTTKMHMSQAQFNLSPLVIVLSAALVSLSLPVASQTEARPGLPQTQPATSSKGNTIRQDAISQPSLNNANSNATAPSLFDSRAWAAGVAKVQKVEILNDKDGVSANGQNEIGITIVLRDASGAPLTGEVPVLIETTKGRLVDPGKKNTALEAAIDRDKTTQGTQAIAQDGKLVVTLVAPAEAGDAVVKVTAGAIAQTIKLSFVPDLRPMIAAGIVEGVINFSKRSGNVIQTVRPGDGFEEEIRRFQRSWGNGNNTFGARAAFFLKGKIKGDALLTAAYDSDKDVRGRAFRDINPEEFYPVYGDASVKGFDAQSTGRLFVRIDKDKSYAMYGDFNTNEGITNDAVQLGRFNRSLTGLKGHWENDKGQVTVFGSKDSLRQVVDEFSARGISGPYTAKFSNGVQNTEVVEIIVRDRNAPSQILSATPQVRFVDYDFEPFSGRILFKGPVPSLDANLNPVSIRVSYEVEEGGPKYWVAGVDGSVNLGSDFTVGGGYARDTNPLAKYELTSLNARWKITADTTLTAEAAQSKRGQVTDFGSASLASSTAKPGAITSFGGTGDAYRLDLRHQGQTLDGRAYFSRVDPSFYNASGSVAAGRQEFGAKGIYKITESVRAIGEIVGNKDLVTDGQRKGASLGLAWDISNTLTVEGGLRYAEQTGAGASVSATSFPATGIDPNNGGLTLSPFGGAANSPYKYTSLRLKGIWRPSEKWSLFAEGEKGLDTKGHALAVGGDYRINEVVRAYARTEWSSGLAGSYGLAANNGRQSATVFGVEAQYMKDGQLFSEYRLRDAIGGREAQAALGLRNFWTVAEGVRLNTSFERVKTLAGPDNKATAATVGIDYTASDVWKGSGRVEWRNDNTSTSFLNTLAAARKLSDNWTLLARNYYLKQDIKGTDLGDAVNDRFQIGAAWRETETNVWNALIRYEYRLEEVVGGTKEKAHIASAHFDYHPRRPLWLSGQVAGKWRNDTLACTGPGVDCINSNFNAQLVQARIMYDVTNKWDVGAMGSVLSESGFRNRRWGWGVETGYLVANNTWLSVGYNFRGIEDKDLLTDYSGRGVFLKLRWKFDENLFGPGKSGIDKTVDSKLNK